MASQNTSSSVSPFSWFTYISECAFCLQVPRKRYLLCPAAFTIGHLKKFIRTKLDLELRYEVRVNTSTLVDCISHVKNIPLPTRLGHQDTRHDSDHVFQIDVFHREEEWLSDQYTLMDIAYRYEWKRVSGIVTFCAEAKLKFVLHVTRLYESP